MVTITNISPGVLHLYSLHTMLAMGEKLELFGTWSENVVKHPDLSLFLGRNRILVVESPESEDKLGE